MKLKRQFLSLLCAMILVLGLSSLVVSGKARRSFQSDAPGDQQTFVVYQAENGETVCREADATEHQRIIKYRTRGPTKVIYSGAPLRNQLPFATTWRDPITGLTLQPSVGLRIVLHGTSQLDQNQEARNAFIVAANRWEAIISTPITVVLDVDFGSAFFGEPYDSTSILGQTASMASNVSFPDIRQRLIDHSPTPPELEIYNHLPALAVPVEFNGSISSTTTIRVTNANARALGIIADISNPDSIPLGSGDAEIGFNSAFQFDFSPDDGIGSNLTDFDSVATHEMGHALGFTSKSGGTTAAIISLWDVFRFRPWEASITTVDTASRILSIGGEQGFFSNQTNTFGTQVLSLSTGGPNPGPNDGDGRQSSHWKDDSLLSTKPYIGIMDPTLARGLRRTISENDITALDLFGYSIGLPPPVRPPNDDFVNAIALQTGSGALTGSNLNATREANEPIHVGYMGDKSVWYTWTSNVNGQITIDTIASNFDTTLAVYVGSSVSQLSNLAQNDDIDGTNRASRVQFNVAAGTTYCIVIDGWNGEFGSITLNWSSTGVVPTPTPTPTPSPLADLAIESFEVTPNPVMRTQTITFNASIHNAGPTPGVAELQVSLPAGTSLISCIPSCRSQFPPLDGKVHIGLPPIAANSSFNVSVMAVVTASSGTLPSALAYVSASTSDPNPTNNSANSATINVIEALPFSNVEAISLNHQTAHVIALRNGTVWGWGENGAGQLGDGTKVTQTLPVQVDDLLSVKAISAGGNFSVALKTDGTVWSWGDNQSGQLGVGSFVLSDSSLPVRVEGLESVVAVAAGLRHVLALKSDGTVWTWGTNESGSLGINSSNPGARTAPVQVQGLSGIVAIFAGFNVSGAVKNDGTVFMWGSDGMGELGTGTTESSVLSPVEVPALKGAKQIAFGVNFTVVVKNDNTVWSFGTNVDGRLGQGLSDSDVHPVPAQIAGLSATTASCGTHAVVALTDGSVKAFGSNNSGQLGLGTVDTNPHPSPISVPGISSAVAVEAGGTFSGGSSLVLVGVGNGNRTIQAWGMNAYGVLGNATLQDDVNPTTVAENLTVARPLVSRKGSIVNAGAQVFVTCSTPTAVVHYTTNGQEPSEGDPVAAPDVPVLINQSLTLKARGWRNGFGASPLTSENYVLSPTPNMIDDPGLFVRQQYLDFLGREPDPSGWNFWTSEITSCGSDQSCIELKRINVSAAFFLSIEFQTTGYLVERTYKAAYGDLIGTSTFGVSHQLSAPGISRMDLLMETKLLRQNLVVGQPGWETQLENNKSLFFGQFISSARFRSAFPPFATPAAQFVDTLNENAGRPLSQTERDALVSGYANNDSSRAFVVRTIVEHPNFVNAEFNRAFVLMQYFGYLQRNPYHPPDADYTGYDFWLRKLNQFNGNFVDAEMVKAFIISGEYRHRFGP